MPSDWSVPLSEEDLDELKTKFMGMPSYQAGGSINSEDLIKLCGMVNYPRSPEQLVIYKSYIDKVFGGVITLQDFMASMKIIYSSSKLARHLANKVDKDGDGIISADEFKELWEVMLIHDPSLPTVDFEQFVKDADLDEDGQVSIEECAKWIEKNSNP